MKKLSRRSFLNNMISCSLALPLSSFLTIPFKDTNNESSTDNHTNSNLFDEMSILFLGTGAADWDEKLYPKNKSDLIAGFHRGLSSILINNSILVDCGPTVPRALDMFRVDVNGITDILITHSHADHFNVKSINEIQTKRSNNAKINLWVHEGVSSYFTTLANDTGCEVNSIKCFEDFSINGLDVTSVEANHDRADTGEQCLHYILKAKNERLFYALDGGWFTTKTWNTLKGLKIDAIVWDTTWGDDNYYCLFSHNNLPMIRMMMDPFMKEKIFNADTKVILSHLGRNYHPSLQELKRKAAVEQMIVPHDGMEIVI